MNLRNHRLYKCARIIYRGWRYRLKVEREEVLFLLRHLGPGQTAIDIGAHRAAFCYWMAKKVGPQGKILAFEPLPMLADYLRDAQTALPLPQMEVIEAALSDQPGTAVLHVPVNSYLGTTTLLPKETGHHQIEVETLRLDDYCEENNVSSVDFIKCDVEGFEAEVFRGAERILRECRPTLLFECENDRHIDGQHERVFPYLESLGYDGFFFRAGKVLPLSHFDLRKHHQRSDRNWSNNWVSIDRIIFQSACGEHQEETNDDYQGHNKKYARDQNTIDPPSMCLFT